MQLNVLDLFMKFNRSQLRSTIRDIS